MTRSGKKFPGQTPAPVPASTSVTAQVPASVPAPVTASPPPAATGGVTGVAVQSERGGSSSHADSSAQDLHPARVWPD